MSRRSITSSYTVNRSKLQLDLNGNIRPMRMRAAEIGTSSRHGPSVPFLPAIALLTVQAKV